MGRIINPEEAEYKHTLIVDKSGKWKGPSSILPRELVMRKKSKKENKG